MKVATLSDMEPLPVIIKEVLYPAFIPFETRTYVGNLIKIQFITNINRGRNLIAS
jgi:hypothetical protein